MHVKPFGLIFGLCFGVDLAQGELAARAPKLTTGGD